MPTRPKVIAAALGAGVGAPLGAFLVWLLGVLVWHASSAAADVDAAIAAVPAPVSALLLSVLAAGSAFVAGYVKSDVVE